MKSLAQFKKEQKKALDYHTKQWNLWSPIQASLRGAEYLLSHTPYHGLPAFTLCVTDQNQYIDWLFMNAVDCNVFISPGLEVFAHDNSEFPDTKKIATGLAFTRAFMWDKTEADLHTFVRVCGQVYKLNAKISGTWGPVLGGLEGRKPMPRKCGIHTFFNSAGDASFQDTLIGNWDDLKISKEST